MATSEGERALLIMLKASRFTAGDEDSKAKVSVDSFASWRMSVSFRGWRSLVMKDAGTVGSCGVLRRTWMRGLRR